MVFTCGTEKKIDKPIDKHDPRAITIKVRTWTQCRLASQPYFSAYAHARAKLSHVHAYTRKITAGSRAALFDLVSRFTAISAHAHTHQLVTITWYAVILHNYSFFTCTKCVYSFLVTLQYVRGWSRGLGRPTTITSQCHQLYFMNWAEGWFWQCSV